MRMDERYTAPWHRQSWDHFIDAQLPQLLGGRLPLSGYAAEATAPYRWRVRLAVKHEGGEVETV